MTLWWMAAGRALRDDVACDGVDLGQRAVSLRSHLAQQAKWRRLVERQARHAVRPLQSDTQRDAAAIGMTD